MIPTEFEQIVQNVQYHTERLQHYALQMRNYKPVSLEIKVSRDYEDGQVAHQHVEPKTVSETFLASITMGEQLTSTLNTVDEKPMSKKRLNVALRNDKPTKRTRVQSTYHESSTMSIYRGSSTTSSHRPSPCDVRDIEPSRKESQLDVFVCKASGSYNWWMNKHGYLTVDGCHFQAHAFNTSILYGTPDIGARVRYDLWKNTKTGNHFAKNICNM